MTLPKACVIGASSGIGRRLAEILAGRGQSLTLVARDREELETVAQHLRVQWNAHVDILAEDISRADFDAARFVERLQQGSQEMAEFYLIAGLPSDDDVGGLAAPTVDALFRVNGLAHVQIVEEALRQRIGIKKVCFASSIAAHAPRGKNMVYAAAKRGAEIYFQALRHRFEDMTVQIWVLGYVDSALSFGKKLLFPAVSAQSVAACLAAPNRRDGVYFLPRFWRFVCLALGSLPWSLYRRLKF